MNKDRLIAIGGAYVDINAPSFPLPEDGLELEKEYVGQEYAIEPGGSAVNFARICASLDIPTTFIGKIGKDEIGSMLSRLLLEQLVEPSFVVSETETTNMSFNMVNEAGKSIMAVVGSANQSLTSDEVYRKVSERLPTSSYLYLGGCFKLKSLMPAFVQLAQDAKEAGVKIVLDHSRLNAGVSAEERQTVKELARISDFYFPSTDEFKELWGVDSVADGLELMNEQAQGTTVVKDGSNGALTMIDGRVVTIPAYSVTPLHTVGAGDSFNAGIIAALTKGQEILEAMRFGCATAALKISQPTLPTYSEVEQFIYNHKM